MDGWMDGGRESRDSDGHLAQEGLELDIVERAGLVCVRLTEQRGQVRAAHLVHRLVLREGGREGG